jgi:uncharacterized membrane protein YdjX (TVP38/TMEM64 family)
MNEDSSTGGKRNYLWVRPVVLVVVVGGLSFVSYKTGLFHFFLKKERLLSFLQSLGPLAVLGFVLLQAAQVVLAPVPGEVTGLLGGYLYGKMGGIFLSTAGLTLGSYVAFALSRSYGRPLVEKFVSKSTMERFDYLLHHKGAFIVFLLFLIPGFPKDTLCYFLGLGHLTAVEFLVIGGTGRLLGTVMLTLGGDFIRHHQYGRFSVLVGVALVVLFLAMAYRDKLERLFRLWHVREYRRKRMKRKSGPPEKTLENFSSRGAP